MIYLFGALSLLGTPAFAEELTGTQDARRTGYTDVLSQEIELVVLDGRVEVILESIAATVGARIEASDGLRGRIIGRQFSGSLDTVLNSLSDELDIEWFTYNDVFYVSHASETLTRVLRLGSLSMATARDGLAEAGLDVPALATQSTANGEAIVLSGPARLVALSEVILESMTEEAAIQADGPRIRIRRANDVSVEPTIAPEGEQDALLQ